MNVSKKEIKRHTKLRHDVVEITKKPIQQIDIVGEVLDELRNGEQAT